MIKKYVATLLKLQLTHSICYVAHRWGSDFYVKGYSEEFPTLILYLRGLF